MCTRATLIFWRCFTMSAFGRGSRRGSARWSLPCTKWKRGPPGVGRLIDFSGYNEFTTEPVPSDGDRGAQMQWYWESGHYKSALGDHILATIFGVEQHSPAEWRFGRDLKPANIDAALYE